MSGVSIIPTVVIVDRGPVLNAARRLVDWSTLTEHCAITDNGSTAAIEVVGDIPFEMWGSGTQALWRLLCAIAYTRHEVSLYEVAYRCDASNRRAAAAAIEELFA